MAFNPRDAIVDLSFEDMGSIPDGTTPEPTQDRVRDWQAALNVARSELRLDVAEDASPAEIARAALAQDVATADDLVVDAFAILCGATPPSKKRPVSPGPAPVTPARGASDKERREHDKAKKAHDDAYAEYKAKVAEWNAGWTGGVPTREQLATLEFRYQAGWFAYLTDAFMNPTSGTAGTKR